MSILVDSDIVIEVLRGCEEPLLERWTALAESCSSVLVSPITIAEVGAGALAREKEAIASLFAPLVCVPIDEQIGHRAGEYLRRYSKSHNLEIADALIAASATCYEAQLWTRNRKHFPMPELRIYS